MLTVSLHRVCEVKRWEGPEQEDTPVSQRSKKKKKPEQPPSQERCRRSTVVGKHAVCVCVCGVRVIMGGTLSQRKDSSRSSSKGQASGVT